MAFENLAVNRLILHEVFKRRHDGNLVPPQFSSQLTQLQQEAMDAFKERVVEAMGSNSQSMEMDIADSAVNSGVEIAASLLAKSAAAYALESQRFPTKLANVQTAKNLPGGMVLIFSGTVGAASYPFVGIIKAETQTGFRRQVGQGTIDAQFVKDLFLTPAAKLYKIGVFIRDGAANSPFPEGWRAHVYDNQMTSSNRDGAARYFFESFLGCAIPVNSAALTKAFFENTREFIKAMPATPEKKNDLLTSLYTYLKVDQTPTITVNAFSTSFLPTSVRDGYRDFMKEKKVPLTSIQKDIADIGNALRLQRVGFRNNIRLTAPPEAFQDMIEIETLPQKNAKPGQPSAWTRITIKDQISDQE
ncbi:nucleoid-associated protein [Reyranella sp.]|uniref:nucleoid-associated protein n=1 Tax=Reyranella sp. TaxID=1929291 RepID=UPI00272FDE98|nr:nucleoid-associated protein [Reyranella sp.]MDP2377627.1 nucleoid-associated protein [Reyranella sp.]